MPGLVTASGGLWAVSPVDWRYRHQVAALAPFLSEGALIRHRVHVEVEYFLGLLDALDQGAMMSDADSLRAWAAGLADPELVAIKDREQELNHDVKAVEYAVKDAVRRTLLGSHFQKVHLGLTSEDVNNLAYSLMQAGAVESVGGHICNRTKQADLLIGEGERLRLAFLFAAAHPEGPQNLFLHQERNPNHCFWFAEQ